MTCNECGSDTPNRVCRDCERDARYEDAVADELRADGGAMANADQAADTDASEEEGFRAIIDAETLAEYVDVLQTVVDECKIHIGDSGIRTKAVDPANVAMIAIELGDRAFESYEAGGGATIGVNLDRLDDVIGMASGGDLVHLELDAETRRLAIDCEGLSYSMALIDPDSIRAEPDIPDLDEELTAAITVEGRALDRGITAADLVSDHIRLVAAPEADAGRPSVNFVAEGDTDDVDFELLRDDMLAADVDDPANSLFSLDYLSDMSGPIDDGDEVRLRLGTEYPMKFGWAFADGDGDVQAMLAPRIQSE